MNKNGKEQTTVTIVHHGCIKMVLMHLFAGQRREQTCGPSVGGRGRKDESYVYVYSEKQLDNVVIGITDMQGNTYHYEVTTISASTYYAISIKSLPAGTYYLCVYQGSNYVIGYLTI